MKTRISFIILFTLITSFAALSQASTGEPWTQSQLLEPADLASTINNPKAEQPLIFCIGPQAVIKGSIYIGPTGRPANLEKLKQELEKTPKDKDIVIYCGCCPFKNCPNIRPAFNLLNEMGFKNQKLLDLKRNVKVDWIDKAYPVE